jgi:hypothetical protein
LGKVTVGDNGILTVESGKRKKTYAEIVNASTAVEKQNSIIAASRRTANTSPS